MWNPVSTRWEEGLVDLPTPNYHKLLLVPKSLVRIKMDFDKDEYYGGSVL